MNSDQHFESLRKLMALKKHEQPPPRYFTDLPSRIWHRIEREPEALPFWKSLFPNVSLNPALAYSFGLLACGSLVFGIGYSLRNEPGQVAQPIGNGNLPLAMPTSEELPALTLSNYQVNQLASTNPVMNSEQPPSLFNGIPLQAAPVSYSGK